MTKSKYKSSMTAPRFARIPSFMKTLAWELGITLDIDVDKFFLREAIRFQVCGDSEKVKRFADALNKAIDEWEATAT